MKKYEKPTVELTRFLVEDIIAESGVAADYTGAKGLFNSDWLSPSYDSGADYSGAKGLFNSSWE